MPFLTPFRVAVLLADGKTVRNIALASAHTGRTIRTCLRRIHRKLGVSRRADLVCLVLSVPDHSERRRRPWDACGASKRLFFSRCQLPKFTELT